MINSWGDAVWTTYRNKIKQNVTLLKALQKTTTIILSHRVINCDNILSLFRLSIKLKCASNLKCYLVEFLKRIMVIMNCLRRKKIIYILPHFRMHIILVMLLVTYPSTILQMFTFFSFTKTSIYTTVFELVYLQVFGLVYLYLYHVYSQFWSTFRLSDKRTYIVICQLNSHRDERRKMMCLIEWCVNLCIS